MEVKDTISIIQYKLEDLKDKVSDNKINKKDAIKQLALWYETLNGLRLCFEDYDFVSDHLYSTLMNQIDQYAIDLEDLIVIEETM